MSLPLSSDKRICLQPFGKRVTQRDTQLVKETFLSVFDARVEVLPTRPHPKAAWYKPRKRWRAGVLLDDLEKNLPAGAYRIVGLTGSDISATKGDIYDWGIFGYGQIGGPACVVSRHRLGAGRASRKLRNERLAKVALHELGHTLGRDHCPNRTCLMEDARGSIRTVDRETDFCSACWSSIAKKLPRRT